MRISTALASTAIVIGVTSLAYGYGQRSVVSEPVPLVPLAQPGAPQNSLTTTEAPTGTSAPETAKSPVADPTQSSAPAATNSATPSQPQGTIEPAPQDPTQAPQPVVTTKTSDVIDYKYGVVQISITKTDNTITDVVLLQGDTSYGRDAAYTALIGATIKTQGTNYGNVSGATFTTDAFKKAVTNTLAKF